MGTFKRRGRGGYLSAAEMLQVLSNMRLRALLQHDTIWLAVDGPTAGLLDACCTGALDGGPGTAAQVVEAVGPSHPGEAFISELNQQLREQWEQRQAQWEQREAQRQQWQAPERGWKQHADDEMRGLVTAPEQQGCQQQGDQQQAEQQPGQQQQQQQGPDFAHERTAEDAALNTVQAATSNGAAAILNERSHHPPQQQEQQQSKQPQPLGSQAQPSPPGTDTAGPGPGSTSQEAAAPQGTVANKAVRLSPEEAFFLHHVLGCLEAYQLVPVTATPPPAAAAAAAPAAAAQDAAASVHWAAPATAGSGAEAGPGSSSCVAPLQQLSTEELWRWCSDRAGRAGAFAALYGAYLHLRAKGWVPRSGLLYGVDYVVYALHPSVVHSEFVALVVPHGFAQHTSSSDGPFESGAAAADATHGSAGCNGSAATSSKALNGSCLAMAQGQVPSEDASLLWIDVQITQRLARQVFKRLLLLHVAVAPGTELTSHSCVDAFAVREVLVRRWVANINREDDTTMMALDD